MRFEKNCLNARGSWGRVGVAEGLSLAVAVVVAVVNTLLQVG
jgi:hypothetical protein